MKRSRWASGQRVGPLHVDRVLRRQHHERRLEPVGDAVDGDLPLLHALEQRRLRLGRGAVDLVADDDVGEHRPRLELEVALFGVVDAHAGHVAGQQIRRELQPADRAVDRAGERLGELGLADARHVLDQQVPLGQQHGQAQPHDFGLAFDHALDVGGDPRPHLPDLGDRRCGRHAQGAAGRVGMPRAGGGGGRVRAPVDRARRCGRTGAPTLGGSTLLPFAGGRGSVVEAWEGWVRSDLVEYADRGPSRPLSSGAASGGSGVGRGVRRPRTGCDTRRVGADSH